MFPLYSRVLLNWRSTVALLSHSFTIRWMADTTQFYFENTLRFLGFEVEMHIQLRLDGLRVAVEGKSFQSGGREQNGALRNLLEEAGEEVRQQHVLGFASMC